MTSASGLALPAWRGLLESRWQRRLAAVIRLSVAYHDASDRLADPHADGRRAVGPPGNTQLRPADAAQLRRLMRQAVAARRALSDTEEALARLSAGNYGRCEQCGAAIPVPELTAEPEARYCGSCRRRSRTQKGTQTGLHGEVRTWRG
jgi:RNA polymerase-binding transcription factor DksA